ncbi:uncharacterized protein M6B38_139775 [Iris pallida]|uniref:Uncharacterized protein n=1 Tax=Iris pallida TaxID=29817 RepID=A0AAX6FDC9_IRIPA|nr:uncharacterized protein M6B38_139775 [Iris pallida]
MDVVMEILWVVCQVGHDDGLLGPWSGDGATVVVVMLALAGLPRVGRDGVKVICDRCRHVRGVPTRGGWSLNTCPARHGTGPCPGLSDTMEIIVFVLVWI